MTLTAILACSSDDGSDEGGFKKVSPSDQTYSIEDFRTVGLKTTKQYDVEGLRGGLDAHFGFWRPDGQDPQDYELRFYASHDAAVEQGTPLAEEVTGEDAVLGADDTTWSEGAKDRRAQGGSTGSNSARFGTVYPRYGDYAIIGNVVMLCQGEDSTKSLGHCSALIDALQATGS
jgi:hypothetical protein